MPQVRGIGARARICIIGGAGFIGSHFIDALLQLSDTLQVTIFDNFSSGRARHFEKHLSDPRLRVICGDAADVRALKQALSGHDLAIHLASNPNIARAAIDPQVDFFHGTLLTQSVVEGVRRAGVPRLLYASGSGVYGDRGMTVLGDESISLQSVSTYGASKVAGEALIASYCSMFGLTACAFRFANVVGAWQTHGVGFDFLRRLRANPSALRILGNGQQSKSYVYVSDVVAAALLANSRVDSGFHVWNVATEDAITVTQIAELAADALQITPQPHLEYTGGDRGWKGDVPIIRLDSSKIRALGWTPQFNSREAVRRSLREMAEEMASDSAMEVARNACAFA